jgi:enoyl-CoA hydratase
MVDHEVRGRVALLTLNRPEARNAINRQVAEEMEAALDAAEANPDVWVMVLAANTVGDRPTFCSGQDLKQIGTPEGNSSTAKGGFGGLAKRERTKPLIAAVDGLATAGGCELVLSCDLVVATPRSSFGLAEVKRNLIAEPIPAQRAYELGLVSRMAEDGKVLDTAMELAEKICENAPLAVWASRKVVMAAERLDEPELWKLSDEAIGPIMRSEDLQEGLRAFAEKRAPQWKGR